MRRIDDANIVPLKPATTYEEQVAIIKGRGILIDDDSSCIEFLKKANYYRLSAYFLPFENTQNVSFKKIANIYEFDKKLRVILFQCIGEIECYLRTQLAYYIAHKHGPLGYLDEDIFISKKVYSKFSQQIDKCKDIYINKITKRSEATYYDNKNADRLPIWVMIEFFSMGMLSSFYAWQKAKWKKDIAKLLGNVNYQYLTSWLRSITDLRNQCAHYSRLYNWTFSAALKMPEDFNTVKSNKLFTQILVLKFLYPDKERWDKEVLMPLRTLLKEYEAYIFLGHIGFPNDWENILCRGSVTQLQRNLFLRRCGQLVWKKIILFWRK